MEAMYELLNKTPLEKQPMLSLNPKAHSFYLMNVDDFKVSNVDNITKIISPLEIAI